MVGVTGRRSFEVNGLLVGRGRRGDRISSLSDDYFGGGGVLRGHRDLASFVDPLGLGGD